MSTIERNIKKKLKSLPKDIAQGLVVQAYKKGTKKVDLQWGQTFTYYDLASLTKILFTVPLVVHAVDKKFINVQQSSKQFLPWFNKGQSIKSLLNHTAGNTWWLPFYESLALNSSFEEKKSLIRLIIRSQKVKKSNQAVYSDVDFLLLGFILENIFEKSWIALWQLSQEHWLQDSKIQFHLANKPTYKRSLYAPTEKCPWRKKVLKGEVHDDNTWALGGIAPHAGLFGSIDAVSRIALQMRDLHLGKSNWLKASNFKTFIKRSMPAKQGDWGLGFMKPSKGKASCGKYFSSDSYGHLGFTGTSLWIDPKNDIIVTLLSNRVFPTRKNTSFNEYRPKIHDWIMEELL